MNDWGIGWTTFWLMLLLGAYHGVNPGMGWLFAVALGMQEKTGRAVAKSLVPIAIGHMFAIGVVVLAAALLGTALPPAGHALSGGRGPRRSRDLPLGAPPPPAVGPYAGGLS